MKIMKLILGVGLLGLLLSGCTTGRGETNLPEPEHQHSIDESQYISNDKYHLHPLSCEHKQEAIDDLDNWPTMSISNYSQKYRCYRVYGGDGYDRINLHDYYKTWSIGGDSFESSDLLLDSIEWTTIVEPTDTEDGYKEAICSTCGHTFRIPFKNNIQRSIDCLEFTLNEDGLSYACEIIKKAEGNFIFPSFYKDKPVTIIKSNAYKTEIRDNDKIYTIDNVEYRHLIEKIESFVVPETIQIVEESALSYSQNGDATIYWNAVNAATRAICCSNIIFGESVKTISLSNRVSHSSGYDAHFAFWVGNSISFAEGIQSIPYHSFYAKKIKELLLPNSLKHLEYNSFEFSNDLVNDHRENSIERLVIGNGIERIPTNAFNFENNFYNLKELQIGSGVKFVEEFAFSDDSWGKGGPLNNLRINVLSNDVIFENGIMGGTLTESQKHGVYASFSHNGPFGVRDASAFIFNEYENGLYLGDENNPYKYLVKAKNSSITSCDIHEDCISIEPEAFEGCSELETITIHGSKLKRVGEYAFEGCSSLQTNVQIQGFSGIQDSSDYSGVIILLKNDNSFSEIDVSTSKVILYDEVLKNCTNVKKVTFGAEISSFPRSCFEGCSGLETVIYGSNSLIKEIGKHAFYGCTKLKYFSNDTSKQYSGEIVIPENVYKISFEAFYNCELITNVVLNENLQEIEYSAFYGLSLTGIILPDNILYIDYGSLLNRKLETIYIENNSYYYSKDYVLYTFSRTRFGSSSNKPTLEYIPYNIKGTIEIDNRVDSIQISNRPNLSGLVIPKSITSIDGIYECYSLSYLEYLGTITEWNEIHIDVINVPATVVHCTDGDVAL